MYCAEDYKAALHWHEQRGHVTGGIQRMREFHDAVSRFPLKRGAVLKGAWQEWDPYIRDLCGLAEFGLVHDDKKIFVRYASRAVLAWGLKEVGL